MTNEDKPIRIVRTPHSKDRPYFSMARATAQDTNISYEALGLLTYLLSKPDSWEINIKDVAKRSTKYKAYKMLRELRKAGYMKLEKEKGVGRFGQWVYQIFETSQLIEFQQVENQLVENQHTQYVQSPEQSTEKQNTSPIGKARKSDPQFDCISRIWNITAGGWVSNMQGMMFGSKKVKGEWLKCLFEPPATLDEVECFEPYLKQRMSEKNIKDVPTAAVTIQRWFYDFRAEVERKKTAPAWSDIPELAGITEIIR